VIATVGGGGDGIENPVDDAVGICVFLCVSVSVRARVFVDPVVASRARRFVVEIRRYEL
jgi:hypothetical protein